MKHLKFAVIGWRTRTFSSKGSSSLSDYPALDVIFEFAGQNMKGIPAKHDAAIPRSDGLIWPSPACRFIFARMSEAAVHSHQRLGQLAPTKLPFTDHYAACSLLNRDLVK